ncbi:MAG: hypothetical protein ACLPLZ_16395 [Terracidiphilus sp.]
MTTLSKTSMVLTALLIGAVSAYGKTNIPELANQCNSLGKAGACRELVKLASTDKDPYTREQATEQLNDQAALANIATQDNSVMVRVAAIIRLTDQPTLEKIAATDADDDVRQAAISKVTDQPLLAKLALEDKNPAIRKAGAQRVTDPVLLAKVTQARALEEQKTAAVRGAVRDYLSAAATLDPSATQDFLTPGCNCDLVVEFQANQKSGWSFASSNTAEFLTPDSVTMDGNAATVAAAVVFHGGGTYMARTTTFSLRQENGNWRIFKIDPPPNAAGPGVSPL